MDPLKQRKPQALRRAVIAEAFGNLIFLLAVGLVLWLCLGTDLRSASRLALTSVVAFGLGLCRSVLRAEFPDPRQDPAGQGLGIVYPLLFWTAVSIGFALCAIVAFVVGWVITH
jgi:hypothetical protein